MSRIAFPFAATLVVCLALLAGWHAPTGVGVEVSATTADLDAPYPSATEEVARLRDHFRTVIDELESADVRDLTAERRRARAGHIEALRGYAATGVFPHNHDFPGKRVPYFVDEHGTQCAMAFLIARSGGEDLVEAVAASRNNATIAQLSDEPELITWLDENGLTVHEAARIQPWYGEPPHEEPATSGVSAGHALGSAIATGAGGAAIVLNLGSNPSTNASLWHAMLGMTAGAAGITLGTETLGDGGSAGALGALNLGVGLASLGLGVRTLVQLPGDAPDEGVSSSRALSLSASPMIGREGGTGVRVRVSF
jgi:hypothetical protein